MGYIQFTGPKELDTTELSHTPSHPPPIMLSNALSGKISATVLALRDHSREAT